MDQHVQGSACLLGTEFGAAAEISGSLLCGCQAGWLSWCANLDTLAHTHIHRTYYQKESVSGQAAQPLDSTVLLLASISLGHLTVQAFSCYW